MMSSTVLCTDGKIRCSWCTSDKDYILYHDQEWGRPIDSDQSLFEKLCLEIFQAGLNWRIILAKRNNFLLAFHQFNVNAVAAFKEKEIKKLLNNSDIVRHQGKIEAIIHNAQCAKELIKNEGSLADFFWQYRPIKARTNEALAVNASKESIKLSKDLKQRHWKFVGPVTLYAFMQAVGIVNGHDKRCEFYSYTENERNKITP